MKLLVDPRKCEGHAFCISLLPDYIDLDADAKAKTAEIPDAVRQDAQAAVENCPALALQLLD